MVESAPIVTPSTPSPAADPKALLAAANSASEKVAALHIVFLAVCAYVLIIVFGTTDLDLLIGKGVKLPVVDVEVPIVGFYAMAPYLLVLVHFNLLLSLQLLSRKLYAFDNAAPKQEIGGLHDQLSIFPYNYYLIGQPSRLVGNFLALVVTITMLLLPLAALLTLQARFLAYQSEAVTWAQRLAVWLDVALVAIFWPVIMDRHDSWCAYMDSVRHHARLRWLRWISVAFSVAVLWLGSETFSLFMDERTDESISLPETITGSSKWLPVTLLAVSVMMGALWLIRRLSRGPRFVQSEATPPLNLGAPGLLTILALGLPLPLMLVIDGEKIDRPAALSTQVLTSLRRLDAREKLLFAKPLPPETLVDLLGTDPGKREAALRSVPRIDLQYRSLRRADLSSAVLSKADLRGARLQKATLTYAQLQGAYLRETNLQGAELSEANL